MDSSGVDKAKREVDQDSYDFYRCYQCGRLITRIEEMQAFCVGSKLKGTICKCGSRKYQPCNLPWWGWFLPRVLKFAYYRIKGVI